MFREKEQGYKYMARVDAKIFLRGLMYLTDLFMSTEGKIKGKRKKNSYSIDI